MARVLNGSSQYLSVATTLLSNEPIGMFCWGNSTDNAANQAAISLGDSGDVNGQYLLEFRGAVAGDPVRASKNDDAGTGVVVAATTAGYSINTWEPASAAFRTGNADRDVYVRGANKGNDTTSRADPTPNYLTVGALRKSAVTQYFAGSIACVFMFDYAPTDAEQALLGKGIHPIDAAIPIVNLRGWYPLMGDDNNRIGSGYPDLSPSGSPTFGGHPAAPIYPRIGALLCL